MSGDLVVSPIIACQNADTLLLKIERVHIFDLRSLPIFSILEVLQKAIEALALSSYTTRVYSVCILKSRHANDLDE